jgi:hypothetical protein
MHSSSMDSSTWQKPTYLGSCTKLVWFDASSLL